MADLYELGTHGQPEQPASIVTHELGQLGVVHLAPGSILPSSSFRRAPVQPTRAIIDRTMRNQASFIETIQQTQGGQ